MVINDADTNARSSTLLPFVLRPGTVQLRITRLIGTPPDPSPVHPARQPQQNAAESRMTLLSSARNRGDYREPVVSVTSRAPWHLPVLLKALISSSFAGSASIEQNYYSNRKD